MDDALVYRGVSQMYAVRDFDGSDEAGSTQENVGRFRKC